MKTGGAKKKILYIALTLLAVGSFFATYNKEVLAFHEETCAEGEIAVHFPDGTPKCLSYSDAQVTAREAGTQNSDYLSAKIKETIATILHWLLNLVGVILGIAGALLDNVIGISVVKMGVFIEKMAGIDIAWQVLRDLLNIVILFLLLFSAIGMILRTDKIVPKGVLTKILIAALLINFSMFFTKVIIDISNVLSFQIYKTMETAGDQGDSVYKGITGAFMQGLDLQSNFDICPEGSTSGICEDMQNQPKFENNLIVRMVMGIITILVTAFVFLTAAIMLIVRFGILVFLIITSPIGFVGSLIPKLEKQAGEWWSTLIGQALFLPVLLLFLLIITKLLGPDSGFEAAMNTLDISLGKNGEVYFGSGGLVAFLQYALIIFFLVTALTVAKSIAGKAGSGVVSSASKWAGSLAFGGLAAAGSYGIGRLGKGLADSQLANSLQSSNSFASRLVGRGLINTGKYFGNASYDVRGTGIGAQLGAGKAAPGFIKREKEEQKRIEDAAKKLKARDGDEETIKLLEIDIKKNEEVIKTLQEQRDAWEKLPEKEREDSLAERDRLDKELADLKAEQKDKNDRLEYAKDNNPAIQTKLRKEAQLQVAELSRKMKSAEIRQAQDAVNEKDPAKKRVIMMGMSEKSSELAAALLKMTRANEKLSNIQKGTTAEWVNKNAATGGVVGAAAENIRKDAGKSKGQKILEEYLNSKAKEKEGGDSSPSGGGGKKAEGGGEAES